MSLIFPRMNRQNFRFGRMQRSAKSCKGIC